MNKSVNKGFFNKRVTCKSCKKLLLKTKDYGTIKGVEIEIMCRNRECRKINTYTL